MEHKDGTIYGTTIITVRRGGQVVIAGDGQVSLGQTIMKGNARKVRRIGGEKNVIVGFAGATADAFTLLDRLEGKLEQYSGQLMRAAVEMAKDWRTDRYLRKLEAMMLVADKDITLAITGVGDVLEPEDGIMAIGSGGNFALAAARALAANTELSAEAIARQAMQIAADICVYTNSNFTVESLASTALPSPSAAAEQSATAPEPESTAAKSAAELEGTGALPDAAARAGRHGGSADGDKA